MVPAVEVQRVQQHIYSGPSLIRYVMVQGVPYKIYPLKTVFLRFCANVELAIQSHNHLLEAKLLIWQ